jgi:hypothetical protein
MTTETPVREPDTGLVAALWRFIEDSGSTAEFFALRCRVREHGALYDSAPALLDALEAVYTDIDLDGVLGGSTELSLMVQTAIANARGPE